MRIKAIKLQAFQGGFTLGGGNAIFAAFLALRCEALEEGVVASPLCCGDTESALFVAVANGVEGTGEDMSITAFLAGVADKQGRTSADVFPTVKEGALGVGVAELVTITGRFVIRKSRSWHNRQAFQSHEEHLHPSWRSGLLQTLHLT